MDVDKLYIIKKEFAHLDNLYFNSAYFGPSPYRVKQKVSNALYKELDPSFVMYNTWIGIPDRVRKQIAKFMNCADDDVCLQTSTTDIINIVANGYDFKKDDYVITLEDEYPSLVLPFMLREQNSDMKFKMLPGSCINPDELKKHLPKQTKIFVASHVTFNTGRRLDIISLGKFLKENDILFVLDATQSVGGIQLTKEELSYVDVLACSVYKWILGPYGGAFGIFNERAQKLIHHRNGNWITSPNSKNVYDLLKYTTDTLDGARKYDRGQSPNMLVNAALEAALEFHIDIGPKNIEIKNAKVRDFFLENYPKNKFDLITTGDNLGNIVCLKSKSGDSIQLETNLKHHHIDVSVRQGNLRLSFHVFNYEKQVETLLEVLEMA